MTLRRIVMSCSHILMLHYDVIRDVTRHVRQGYKRAWCCIMGEFLVQLSLGKEVYVHAWIDVLPHPHWESLLPSNITDWVVITRLCVPVPAYAPLHLRTARECHVLPKEYCLYRTIMPFGWCLCALLIELLFTSPEVYRCCHNTHISALCTSHIYDHEHELDYRMKPFTGLDASPLLEL